PLFCYFFLYHYAAHRDLHSFPTRRSSDLGAARVMDLSAGLASLAQREAQSAENDPGGIGWFALSDSVYRTSPGPCSQREPPNSSDRKSTRLNSSHVEISYAVFCLKKKKKN